MHSIITQARKRPGRLEILSPCCVAQDDGALRLNIFATDLPNHPKHVLDEPTVAAGKILVMSSYDVPK
jgi:hypothetical protein